MYTYTYIASHYIVKELCVHSLLEYTTPIHGEQSQRLSGVMIMMWVDLTDFEDKIHETGAGVISIHY